MKKILNPRGFTMIELIIYISLVSIFISGAIFFAWDIIYAREKTSTKLVVQQNARRILSKISNEIRRAKSIITVTPDQLILENEGSTTTLTLSSNKITISDSSGTLDLSSNQVAVLDEPDATSPLFTNLSSSNNNSKNINVNLLLKQSQVNVSSDYQVQYQLRSSIELNNPANSARSLVANVYSATLSSSQQQLTGIALENSSSASITMDRVVVSWTGGSPSSRLTSIEINGATVWSGTATSGSNIDIADTNINPNVLIPINKFQFSASVSNALFTIEFVMTDGSSTKAVIDFS